MASAEPREPVLKPRGGDVVWRRIDDGGVLLDLRSSTYLAINGSATALWQRLEHGATRQQLIETLRSAFELDEDHAARDVDAFIADCRARELLQEEPPPT